MRRALLLVGAGLLGLLAGLVAHLPAGRALELLAPPGITAEGVRGSVWQGSARRLAWGGPVALTAVNWELAPLALLRGRLGLAGRFEVLGGRAEVRGTVARDGDATIHAATFRGPAAGLEPLLPASLVALDGELVARVTRARWVDGRAAEVDARLLWDRARVDEPVSVALGSVVAQARTDTDGGLRATLDNRGGALALDGEGSLGRNGDYRARLRLRPGADTPAEVRDLLESYAERDNGGFVIRASGRLPR